jgi:threonine synthase
MTRKPCNPLKLFLKEYDYVACPHTAIAWKALKAYQQEHLATDNAGVFLSTAHPCKFPDVFTKEISDKINIPEQVKELEKKAHHATSLGTDFEEFKGYLLNKFRIMKQLHDLVYELQFRMDRRGPLNL